MKRPIVTIFAGLGVAAMGLGACDFHHGYDDGYRAGVRQERYSSHPAPRYGWRGDDRYDYSRNYDRDRDRY
jgi:hypothetical protein